VLSPFVTVIAEELEVIAVATPQDGVKLKSTTTAPRVGTTTVCEEDSKPVADAVTVCSPTVTPRIVYVPSGPVVAISPVSTDTVTAGRGTPSVETVPTIIPVVGGVAVAVTVAVAVGVTVAVGVGVFVVVAVGVGVIVAVAVGVGVFVAVAVGVGVFVAVGVGVAVTVTVIVLLYSLSDSLLSEITPVSSVTIFIVCAPALNFPIE
jgi:hypothetical protein